MVWINAISNNLSKADSKNLPDVIFATADGQVFMHKMVLFSGLPMLRDMLCNACVDAHEELVIVIPDVTKVMVQEAVDKLYEVGNGDSLARLFSMKNKEDNKYPQTTIIKDDEALSNLDAVETNPSLIQKASDCQESFKNKIKQAFVERKGLTAISDKRSPLKQKEKRKHKDAEGNGEANKKSKNASDDNKTDPITEYNIKLELIEHEDTEHHIKLELEEHEDTELMTDETISNITETSFEEESLLDNSNFGLCDIDNPDDEENANCVEVWLQDIYPELYNIWKEVCRAPPPKPSQTDLCSVCKLKPVEGINYGVGVCQADRHFIKRTFNSRLAYPPCSAGGTCLPNPRPRGWCQPCRLKAVLSTPINIGLIRIGNNTQLERSFENEERKSPSSQDEKDNCSIKPDIEHNQNRKEYKVYVGAEVWLQDTHPALYQVWKEACKTSQPSTDGMCQACKLRPGVLHYGARMCEAEKQFIKRTFHKRLSYPNCDKEGSCPPRARGWCQQCRLRACLSMPIDFSLVRFGANFKINRRGKEQAVKESHHDRSSSIH